MSIGAQILASRATGKSNNKNVTKLTRAVTSHTITVYWHIFELLVFHLTPSLLYSHRIVRTFAKGRKQQGSGGWRNMRWLPSISSIFSISSISSISTPFDTAPDGVKVWALRWSGRCCAGSGWIKFWSVWCLSSLTWYDHYSTTTGINLSSPDTRARRALYRQQKHNWEKYIFVK